MKDKIKKEFADQLKQKQYEFVLVTVNQLVDQAKVSDSVAWIEWRASAIARDIVLGLDQVLGRESDPEGDNFM